MPDPANDRSSGRSQMSPEERAAFEHRVSDLGARLGKVKAQQHAEAETQLDAEMRGRGMAYGMRMAAELVGAVIVGAFIGIGLDWLIGTKPWLFLLFFVLPGDPATLIAGGLDRAPNPEVVAQANERYGFNDPLWRQFVA